MKVLLDRDLDILYNVETRILQLQVGKICYSPLSWFKERGVKGDRLNSHGTRLYLTSISSQNNQALPPSPAWPLGQFPIDLAVTRTNLAVRGPEVLNSFLLALA